MRKKLPSILKKIKANVVFDLNGLSSSAKIPQLIAIDQTIPAAKNKINKCNQQTC